jgi:hypothetical protein
MSEQNAIVTKQKPVYH